ncbi:MAG: hypothetical protein OQK70_10465 [Gammaproteobacteria bacterium]|nr:hypothetical protein [Gammaproteobacteria bacterium]
MTINSRMVFAFLLSILPITNISAKDITSRIITTTDLDKRISAVCKKYCQGNRSHGKLDSVDISHLKNEFYNVTLKVTFVNKNDITGMIPLQWNHTIKIKANGTLNSKTCQLTVGNIRIDDDKYGLGNIAKQQEGKTHIIKNCSAFT